MTRQTSLQVTEQTERQVKALEEAGFGTGFTNIVRLAVDRMYRDEVDGDVQKSDEVDVN